MSVYSHINFNELEQLFQHYALGQVIDYVGITDGIDNSNYFVSTDQAEFVLTIFESMDKAQTADFIALLHYVKAHDLPCVAPIADKQGNSLLSFHAKPVAVFNRIAGKSVINPTLAQCEQIGVHLARLHLCTQNFDFPYQSQHDLSWCEQSANSIQAYLTADDADCISSELNWQKSQTLADLPTGVIHADLFRDNVLFIGEQLTGLLDFYSAGVGYLVLDLAITVNDWCRLDEGLDQHRLMALINAYNTVRPLTVAETKVFLAMLRLAALRFWLSRCQRDTSQHIPSIAPEKDPKVFKRLLMFYRQHGDSVINPIF